MSFYDLTKEQQVAELARSVRAATGLVTEEVAAGALDVEPSTLATWRSQGKGPDYVKLGKGVFYTVSALAAWINTEAANQNAVRKKAA